MNFLSEILEKVAKEQVQAAADKAAAKAATKRLAVKAPTRGAEKAATRTVKPAEIVGLDPRIEARKNEVAKVRRLAVDYTHRNTAKAPTVSIFDMEGKPFITSMSDRSAGGEAITGVNDVPLQEPFELRGGQDYMFNNPGSVWAADKGNARAHVDLANRLRVDTGQDPVLLPWAMGPTSSKFSHMPRGLMLKYAAAALKPAEKKRLAAAVRSVLPDFKSVDDDASATLFMGATGKARGALNRVMDQFRLKGGLGLGEAIAATNDLSQTAVPLTGLRNVGLVEPKYGVGASDHPSYRASVPGEGVGQLQEPIGALDLLPELRGENGAFDFPVGVVPGVSSPLRALQMKPKGGIITEDILRSIADRYGYAKGGPVKARLACRCSQ